MTLGYSLTPALLKRVGIAKVRAYIQAANLFTITKYTGPDPEISSTGNITSAGQVATDFGIDEGAYASTRQYLLGLQITF